MRKYLNESRTLPPGFIGVFEGLEGVREGVAALVLETRDGVDIPLGTGVSAKLRFSLKY